MPVDFSSDRIGHYVLKKGLSAEECYMIANRPQASRIIFDEPLSAHDLALLEENVFAKRQDITLVFYSTRNADSSLAFLHNLPSVRKITVSISKPVNVEALGKLDKLQDLRMAAYDLQNFDFLSQISPGLTELYLYSTISKKPNLKHISRFSKLETLHIEGHSKYIEQVNTLKNLRAITLRSVLSRDVNFLSGLTNLNAVDIKLGRVSDFSALETLPNLKYLELWQIRLLKDISFISRLSSLQYLFLQELRNIEILPLFDQLHQLRRIEIVNLKGLKNLDAVATAPALVEFILRNARHQSPDNILRILKNKKLRIIYCDFESQARNANFQRKVVEQGSLFFSAGAFDFI